MSDKDEEVKAALELCKEIEDLLPDMPDTYNANNFREGVEAKVTDMQEWIKANNTVTEKQMNALENMKRGVEKWIR